MSSGLLRIANVITASTWRSMELRPAGHRQRKSESRSISPRLMIVYFVL